MLNKVRIIVLLSLLLFGGVVFASFKSIAHATSASPAISTSASRVTTSGPQNIRSTHEVVAMPARVTPFGAYPETCGNYPDVQFLDDSFNIHCYASNTSGTQVYVGVTALTVYTGSYTDVEVNVDGTIYGPLHRYETYWIDASVSYVYFA
ncbi:MAG TPA: hypothetical protein VKV19_10505 [Ktedonobacteraceae bacterium]|nr:hypothetical protein [Ktedonobacteraceae bacterium]